MKQPLSGVTVVIFIACGALTFILLFIFAKRQIMRFALRSRRGPHVPIGHGTKNSIKTEVERCISVIEKITYEPMLLDEESPYILPQGEIPPPYYYRMKAVNDMIILKREIMKQYPKSLLKKSNETSTRSFLMSVLLPPMNGSGQKMIHQFCDLYEHARHDPSDFDDEEYQCYAKLYLKLIDVAKLLKSFPVSRKSSPTRSPLKKSITTDVRLRTSDKRNSFEDDNVLLVTDKESRPHLLHVPGTGHDNETSV